MLKIIYAFFVGILLAIFVGAGIAAFYTEPQPPKAPDFGNSYKTGLSDTQQAEQQAFDKQMENFNNNKMNPYNRNVSVIALVASVIFVTIGLLLERRINILADGSLLGGVFTLIYSMGRGFAANDSKYSFIAVSIGLLIVLTLGYIRFIRPQDRAK